MNELHDACWARCADREKVPYGYHCPACGEEGVVEIPEGLTDVYEEESILDEYRPQCRVCGHDMEDGYLEHQGHSPSPGQSASTALRSGGGEVSL